MKWVSNRILTIFHITVWELSEVKARNVSFFQLFSNYKRLFITDDLMEVVFKIIDFRFTVHQLWTINSWKITPYIVFPCNY